MLDAIGRSILNEEVEQGRSTINLSGKEEGLYILKMSAVDHMRIVKMIKQRKLNGAMPVPIKKARLK